jgi:lysophospholipase L1-like esterase
MITMLAIGTCFCGSFTAAQEIPSVRWKEDLGRFDREDAAHLPAEGGIVFVGSSSVRLWNLAKSFEGMPTINRGFGGSEASDAVALADLLVVKYQPKVVVFYSGDNDLAHGKSPSVVASDVERFVSLIREKLPDAKIILLSIKPSLARAALRDKQHEANLAMEKVARSTPNVRYVDVGRCLLDDQGEPRGDSFLADHLHLNEEGYRRWTEILKPILDECLNSK